MIPKEYHTFIKAVQDEEFPDTFDYLEFSKKDDGTYYFFAPSHHFKLSKPLMTENIVTDLKDNKKRLLSVGCGPAYLERLFVSRLGVKPAQITLADISDEYAPDGFEFYKFDMYQDWPNLGRTFDYVIFPESIFLDKFSYEINTNSFITRYLDQEDGLCRLLYRSLNILNPLGQIRLTSGVTNTVRDPVKERIETEFPNVKMHSLGELTYITKR